MERWGGIKACDHVEVNAGGKGQDMQICDHVIFEQPLSVLGSQRWMNPWRTDVWCLPETCALTEPLVCQECISRLSMTNFDDACSTDQAVEINNIFNSWKYPTYIA